MKHMGSQKEFKRKKYSTSVGKSDAGGRRLPSASTTATTPPSSGDKIYVVLPDKDAENEGDLCVVDESGEDYLFCISLRGD